jgi:hypothetical protein
VGIAFIDPRPPTRLAVDPFVPRPHDRDGGARTIGLLANGFPDSAAFLTHLAAALDDVHTEFTWHAVTKARPPDPLTDDQLAALTRCDAVIAAYGH